MPEKYVSILDKVREKLKNKPEAISDAVKWYRKQIRELGGATKTHLLKDPKRTKDWFYPGTMYLFAYDPKTKETLPYWDKFPLVFPIEFYSDGFLGINLHYLNHQNRLALFHNLLSLVDRKNMNSATRLNISYRILKGVTKFKAFQPCLKRYLATHVQSQAIKIDAYDWETALFLPVEKFVRKTKTQVWSDSMDIIAGQTPRNTISPIKSAVISSPIQPVVRKS